MREEERKSRRSFWEFVERDGRKVDYDVEALAAAALDAAIEVHRHLGPGHPERVYENALCVELSIREVPFQRQVPVHLTYKGHDVGDSYIDVSVGGALVLELKAVEAITDTFKAQTVSYLVALDLELGLLMNFNVPLLKDGVRRVIRTKR